MEIGIPKFVFCLDRKKLGLSIESLSQKFADACPVTVASLSTALFVLACFHCELGRIPFLITFIIRGSDKGSGFSLQTVLSLSADQKL